MAGKDDSVTIKEREQINKYQSSIMYRTSDFCQIRERVTDNRN